MMAGLWLMRMMRVRRKRMRTLRIMRKTMKRRTMGMMRRTMGMMMRRRRIIMITIPFRPLFLISLVYLIICQLSAPLNKQ